MILLLWRLLQGDALSHFAAGATYGELGTMPPPIRHAAGEPGKAKAISRGCLVDMNA